MVTFLPLLEGLLESPSGLKTCTIVLGLFVLFLRQCCPGWLPAQYAAFLILPLAPPEAGLQVCPTIPGLHVVGIKPRALCTARQVLYQLSHVPSVTGVFKSRIEL